MLGRPLISLLPLLSFFLQRPLAAESSLSIRPWQDYRTIMWIGDSAAGHPDKLPVFFERLREMGINSAMVYGAADPKPIVDAGFPYYVENMVNRGLCLKFNSKVTDWDKTITDWARNGRAESGLVRDYCLDDLAWLNSAKTTVGEIVLKNAPYRPLAYNLRDELSTTISANPFDYDFSPIALEQFRLWLKAEYGDLATLNAEWDTRFSSWSEVKPFTTDQIKNRMAGGAALPRGSTDWQQLEKIHFDPQAAKKTAVAWNFSPWADFRTYMDLSLARALESLRQTAHAQDPQTPVGIEGTQMPNAFGGYDLWRLSQVLDWVEPYDIGCAREIFGSFMPGRPVLTTVFESDTAAARRRLWHLLLEGDRGCLVWWSEDCLDWQSADLRLTPKAQALAPVLNEMTSPLAKLFLRAKRESDPIFIHYSQPSIQIDWLIESTVDGSTWLRRFSSFEAEHNQMSKARVAWVKALQDLGYSPRFLSSAQIESGALAQYSSAVLVLPSSYALTDTEQKQLAVLLQPHQKPGRINLLAEGSIGCFDGHGKLRAESIPVPFDGLSTNAGCTAISSDKTLSSTRARSSSYLEDRLDLKGQSKWLAWLKGQLAQFKPEISVPLNADVRVHRFRIKPGRLVAFERNINYAMSEDLKQAGGNQALEKPIVTEAVLNEPAHVYDLREGKYLGRIDRIRFTLNPWQPSLFALLNERVSEKTILSELAKEVTSD